MWEYSQSSNASAAEPRTAYESPSRLPGRLRWISSICAAASPRRRSR
ncbi:hypothetical protein ACFQ0M_26340 [Kitasatospora aburaviensis]